MQIKLLALDVDGVLTNGTIWLSADGQEYKCFHTHDGYGIRFAQQAGITIAVISGRRSETVTRRLQELNVKHIYQGCGDKLPVLQKLMSKLNISLEEVAYVGDDIPDLPVIKKVGLGIAVANAVAEVKSAADWVTTKPGGEGAVREACEYILNNASVTLT